MTASSRDQPGDRSGSDLTLHQLIAQRIQSSPQGRITFAEFMDLALYHPQLGYYARPEITIGTRGDYYTSTSVSSVFGELLGEQIADMWIRLGQPISFQVVEMGAGSGALARDLLRYIGDRYQDLSSVMEYRILERSPGLIAQQQQQLQGIRGVSWWVLDQIPPESITGCFLSNELVDALPVHRVEWRCGQLREIYVGIDPDSGNFTEILGNLSTPQIQDYFDHLGISLHSGEYPEGYRTEINLAALDWLSQIARCLHHGYVLTIDYGYTADRYYHPRRSQGTLLCYHQHTTHADPYIQVGEQDLTAHVDFSALQLWGSRVGLESLGLTRQEEFLATLGLIERVAALSQADDVPREQVLRQRQTLHLLMDPMGLGNYRVLIQGKGVMGNDQQTPKGLQGV